MGQMRFDRPSFRSLWAPAHGDNSLEKQKEQRISPLLPARTLPQVLRQNEPKFKLLQRRPRRAGANRLGRLRGSVPCRVGMDYAVFAGAETANAALVEPTRRTSHGVLHE